MGCVPACAGGATDRFNEAIRNQVTDILGTPGFIRAPRIAGLLEYLVDEELAGRGDRLRGYKVGVEGLGKSEDFDPSVDAGVRVETARLRRMLAAYYAEHPLASVAIEVPKGSYRPRFETLNPASSTSLEQIAVPSAGPAIAILSFATRTGSSREVLLATGLRAELLVELFRYREFYFIDASDRDEIAADLCGNLECEFAVRATIGVTDQVVSVQVSTHDLQVGNIVWAERFELPADGGDLFGAVTDLATEITGKLARPAGMLAIAAVKKRLGRAPIDWNASDCILRWHLYRLRERTPESHAAVRSAVLALLRSDPGFSMGYVIYGMLRIDEVVYRLNPRDDPATTFSHAEYLVNQAIAADPENALAHYVKAQCFYFTGRYDDFRDAINRAIALNPGNTDIVHHAGAFLICGGERETGTRLLDQANMAYNTGIGYRLAHLIRHYIESEDAESSRDIVQSTFVPRDFSIGQIAICLLHARWDRMDDAVEALHRAYSIEQNLHRSLSELVSLWFQDKSLASQVMNDLGRVQRESGTLVRLL